MLEFIRPLAEKAIELLKEGERKRSAFFDEIARPLHEQFLELRKFHLQTYEDVRTSVMQPGTPLVDVARLVATRTAAEAHTWKAFSLLSEQSMLSPRAEVATAFNDYLKALSRCLSQVCDDGKVGDELRFYSGLATMLMRCNLDGFMLMNRTEIQARQVVVDRTNKLQSEFSDYCAEVEIRYLILRRVCKA